MADDDHSLLLLDFLDTIEIRSHRVVLERVHSFEELNEKKFPTRHDGCVSQLCPKSLITTTNDRHPPFLNSS